MTMQVDAMFKNGTTPANNKDWQRLFLGVLRRSFEIEDVKFLRYVNRCNLSLYYAYLLVFESLHLKYLFQLHRDRSSISLIISLIF